jgi:hypothetical protein
MGDVKIIIKVLVLGNIILFRSILRFINKTRNEYLLTKVAYTYGD